MIARSLTATLAILTLLSACGGGGSDGVDLTSGRNAAFVADSGQTVTTARLAASATPVFGDVGVLQTAQTDPGTAATGIAIVPQPNGSIDIVLARRDGNPTRLNSRDDTVARNDVRSPTGRLAREGFLLDQNRSGIMIGTGLLDFTDPPDPRDWLVGGYWLRVTGEDWETGAVTGAEVGAFGFGPELVDKAAPDSGTATYRGLAGGLYAARAGTDAAIPTGTHDFGDYQGVFTATADFAAGTVSGGISAIQLVGLRESPTGATDPIDRPAGAVLLLNATPINAGTGQMAGTVTLVSPGSLFTSQDGSWGSRLSARDDANGRPRLLAGTHAASGMTAGGSEMAYIGVHFGTTGDFE